MADRRDDDPEVEPERPVVDIPDVEDEAVVPAYEVPALHLGEPSDAGLHVVPSCLLRRIARQVLEQEWPWSHDAHLALDDVPQLRQLVEAGSPENRSQPRDTCVQWHDGSVGPERITHRPELDDRERRALVAWADLPEQHRAPHRRADRDGDGEHDR